MHFYLIKKMTSLDPKSDAKNALRSLIKIIFAIEINEFKDNIDFSDFLDICKNIKNLNLKGKLLFMLYEIIFIEGKELKAKIDKNILKCFKICIAKNENPEETIFYEEYIKKEVDFLDIIFPKKKGWTKEIINLISFIMVVKKDFGVLFKCLEIVMSYTDKYYIPNNNGNYDFSKYSFDDLLDKLYNYFMMNDSIEQSKNYSIIYKDDNFINIDCKTEDILKYMDKQKYDIKKLKEFTKINYDVKDKDNNNEEYSDFNKDNDDKFTNNEKISNISKINDDKLNNNKEHCSDNKENDTKLKDNNNKKLKLAVKSKNLEINNDNHENGEKLMHLRYEEIINNIKDFKEEFQKQIDELKRKNIDCEEKMNIQKDDYKSQIKKLKVDHDTKFKIQKDDYESQIKKLKVDHDTKFKIQKDDYESQIIKLKVDHDTKFKIQKDENLSQKKQIDLLNNQTKQLKNNIEILKDKILSLEVTQKNMDDNFNAKEQDQNKRIKILEGELDSIKCRGLIKSIIDFIYYAFFNLNFDKNYGDKKNEILQQIELLKKDKESDETILEKLYEFVNRIYNNKKGGDDLSHKISEIETLFKIIKSDEKIQNIFVQLNLGSYFSLMNKIYKNNTYQKEYNSVISLIENKKEIFLNSIKKQ